jgi:hypothetical protein
VRQENMGGVVGLKFGCDVLLGLCMCKHGVKMRKYLLVQRMLFSVLLILSSRWS